MGVLSIYLIIFSFLFKFIEDAHFLISYFAYDLRTGIYLS